MKKFLVIVSLAIFLSCSGCGVLKFAFSDIGGWDLSACVDGFDTCLELYNDNKDKVTVSP